MSPEREAERRWEEAGWERGFRWTRSRGQRSRLRWVRRLCWLGHSEKKPKLIKTWFKDHHYHISRKRHSILKLCLIQALVWMRNKLEVKITQRQCSGRSCIFCALLLRSQRNKLESKVFQQKRDASGSKCCNAFRALWRWLEANPDPDAILRDPRGRHGEVGVERAQQNQEQGGGLQMLKLSPSEIKKEVITEPRLRKKLSF